jgi:hypothetical protein
MIESNMAAISGMFDKNPPLNKDFFSDLMVSPRWPIVVSLGPAYELLLFFLHFVV